MSPPLLESPLCLGSSCSVISLTSPHIFPNPSDISAALGEKFLVHPGPKKPDVRVSSAEGVFSGTGCKVELVVNSVLVPVGGEEGILV